MKKGFFNLEDEDEGYDFLETLNINNKEIDALYYLHGICHEFSLALNKIFGYDIVLWTNYDEDVKSYVLVHAFNMFQYKGKQYYADIRGITDNLEDIINEFDYSEEILDPCGCNSKEAKRIFKKLGSDTNISNDTYEIINAYKSYYQLRF